MFDTLTRMGASAAGAYEIERSLRFDSSSTTAFTRTPSSSADDQIQTYSFWCKRCVLDEYHYVFSAWNGSNTDRIGFTNDGQFFIELKDGGSTEAEWHSDKKHYDPSAWYHVVVAFNTTLATENHRMRAYINGEEITDWDLDNDVSQNYEIKGFGQSGKFNVVGAITNSGSSYINHFNGYIAEFHFIDGAQKVPGDFGKTDPVTGQWIPIRYGGSYGSQGWYLNFSDNSNTTAGTLGADSSGNGLNWTPVNFSVSSGLGNDSFIDTPTNNFCTMNPLTKQNATVTNGNLSVSTDGNNSGVYATMTLPSTGKWYFEMTQGSAGEPGLFFQTDATSMPRTFQWNASNNNGFFALMYSGLEVYDGTNLIDESGSPWNSYPNGTVYSFLFDRDNHTMKFRYNNGNEESCSEPTHTRGLPIEFGRSVTSTWQAHNFTMNFGGNGFAYTPPDGYNSICTANLPDPTITKGSDYFDTVLYTGTATGSATQTISGVGFAPNLTWIKNRGQTYSHMVLDTVRGAGNYLEANSINDEDNANANGNLTSFTSDGFVTTRGSSNGGRVNENGETYVSWNWKESTTAGFDILTYTGSGSNKTVSHGLGVKPQMMIIKNRDDDENWRVYHEEIGATHSLYLQDNDSKIDANQVWNDTEPTSSVFSVGTYNSTNGNGKDYIAYCFSSVEGYSKFGAYEGNGSSNGVFVHTGFRPAFIMSKCTSHSDAWHMFDTTRDPDNLSHHRVQANLNDVESTSISSVTSNVDILSNGFKWRGSSNDTNGSGDDYIYMAFAESPFKYANAR